MRKLSESLYSVELEGEPIRWSTGGIKYFAMRKMARHAAVKCGGKVRRER